MESLPMEIWDDSSLGMLKGTGTAIGGPFSVIPTVCVCVSSDKSEGNEFSGRFDKAWATLKEYCDCLGIEVSERVSLSNMLASCLVQQATKLAEVKENMKVIRLIHLHIDTCMHTQGHPPHAQVYKTLMSQLSSCREKLGLRQKDLERAQQTATSDPSCKEDLTEVGDMEIDSDEETMETAPPQAPIVPSQLPPPDPHPSTTFTPPPKMFNSLPPDTSPVSSAPLVNPSPHTLNSAPQLPPQIINSSPHMLSSAPPPMMNTASQIMNAGPLSQPVPYSQPYLPPMQGFRPPPSQFSRPPVPPLAPHGPMQRMSIAMQGPPSGLPPHYPPGRHPVHSRGPPPLRGPVRPPHAMAPPRPGMVAISTTRLQRPPLQPSGERRPMIPGADVRGRETHIEAKPVVYVTEPEQKSSLDDRLQSLVVKKSLGSVLLQEYAESEESGEKPYTPTTTPLPASPGDDESVTTPTPQFDASPTTPEDVGSMQFNPANPIMKALYHSPTHSPEDVAAVEGSTAQSEPGGEGSLLSEVDTGMLQNILKNVKVLKQPATPSPSSSPPATKPSELTSPPPELATPIQTTLTTPPPSTAVAITAPTTTPPPDKTEVSKPISSAANIKITSSLTSLLDEIFPQLSKSLQERKRKQETGTGPETPVKLPKVAGVAPNEAVRPLAQPQLNGPPSNGPRGPMVMVRSAGPGGVRPAGMILRPRPPPNGPPGMILRPPGPRPPPEGPPGMILRPPGMRPTAQRPEGVRPRGPPFEGNFRPRGPPRLEGNFRPPRPPGMQLVGDRFQFPPGQRPPFRLRSPNSGPPPRQVFPLGPSFLPRGPSVSGPRPPFGQGTMRPPAISDTGMEPNHFAENPQTHDGLQPIPPPGMGMWP